MFCFFIVITGKEMFLNTHCFFNISCILNVHRDLSFIYSKIKTYLYEVLKVSFMQEITFNLNTLLFLIKFNINCRNF